MGRKIYFASAPCGSGKTFQLVRRSCQLVHESRGGQIARQGDAIGRHASVKTEVNAQRAEKGKQTRWLRMIIIIKSPPIYVRSDRFDFFDVHSLSGRALA